MPTKKPKNQTTSSGLTGNPALDAQIVAILGGPTAGSDVLGSTRYQNKVTPGADLIDPNSLFPGAENGVAFTANYRPLYVKGDEWNELPTGADLATLQHNLIQAGYMSADNIVFGSPDQKTASAMAQLLATANGSGVQWRAALSSRLAQAAQQPPADRPHRDPLVITLSNPDDIRATVQAGANAIFGKYLDQNEVDKFVNGYQQQEAAYQTAQYQATGYDPNTGQMLGTGTTPPAQGTTLTAPANAPGMQREFFNQMAAAHPTETRVAIFQDKLDEILNALRGPQ